MVVVDCIMTLQGVPILVSRICVYYLIWQRGHCRCGVVKDLVMGRLPRIMQVPPLCNHTCPYKRRQRGIGLE